MKRFALVNNQNVVENIILWDGTSAWAPPENMQLIDAEGVTCSLGWTYEAGVFVKPPEPEVVEPVIQTTAEPVIEPVSADVSLNQPQPE